jgi:hypothetical protein
MIPAVLRGVGHEAGSKIGHKNVPEAYSYWSLSALQAQPPHYVKMGVLHSLVNRAKVIRQYQKDLNNEIKTIRHDQILNEYPHEFVDCVMKPSRSNRPSSDTVYQGRVIILYVKGISSKLRRGGNRFNIRTIFYNKSYTPWDIDENWTG